MLDLWMMRIFAYLSCVQRESDFSLSLVVCLDILALLTFCNFGLFCSFTDDAFTMFNKLQKLRLLDVCGAQVDSGCPSLLSKCFHSNIKDFRFCSCPERLFESGCDKSYLEMEDT